MAKKDIESTDFVHILFKMECSKWYLLSRPDSFGVVHDLISLGLAFSGYV